MAGDRGRRRRIAIARALLQAGADPNAKDDLQDSAYLHAGAEGLNEILEGCRGEAQ